MSHQSPIAASTLRSLFAYKAWANHELLAVMAGVDAVTHAAEVHNAIRILNHVYVVDAIFSAHLQGVAHAYTAANTPETPALPALAAAVSQLDAWYIGYVESLVPASLNEPVRFTFTDADTGLMNREEILLHIVTHGGYHRGAAGQVLRGAGGVPPRDLYTRFLHMAQPQRRS
jgi:uncharacterized damage-inducible protein DinB